MYIRKLNLKNWRNFKEASIEFSRISYVIGPNASGKSNLLDVFRFLRDICKPSGGGLQQAVAIRDGIPRLRCLHARKDPEVRIEVHLSARIDSVKPEWKYILGFKPEGKGAQRILVSTEEVWKDGVRLVHRPDDDDRKDSQLLTETHLEQTRANQDFRTLSTVFSQTTYLHLVPQMLKYAERIGGQQLEDDPFGQGFLEKIARSTNKARQSRLKKIEKALSAAVPNFKELRLKRDNMGHPHLEALYEHYRPNAGWQSEEHFSDGTLRLIGILWSLLDGQGLLLMEEPELSLHRAVVEQVPLMIDRILRQSKNKRQVLISTHSDTLLSNPGIDARSIVVLEPDKEGSRVRGVSDEELAALEVGLSVADVVMPKTRPDGVEQLGFWK